MYIEPNPTEEEVEEQIKVIEKVNEAINEADKSLIQLNYTGTLVHKWFKADDPKQKMVAYAYKLWWMDFVKLIECENWQRRIDRKVRDRKGYAYWLCQINEWYHKIPEEYLTNWVVAVEYCYKKWKQWTPFYWPSRIVKWKKCANYVSDRFYLE